MLDSTLNTDEAQFYKQPGKAFAAHEAVNHGAGEYARGETTTNTVEGYFSIFKRGMVGVYQHCGEQHLVALISATQTDPHSELRTLSAQASP